MITLFLPDFNLKGPSHDAILALSTGLRYLGVSHRVLAPALWNQQVDGPIVTCGWMKSILADAEARGRRTRHSIIQAHLAAGETIVVIERGFVGDRDQWHALGWNGFAGSLGMAAFRTDDVPADRVPIVPGLSLAPWRSDGEIILFCAQVPWDAQMLGCDTAPWIAETLARIRTTTDRPVVFRPHPKVIKRRRLAEYGEIPAWVEWSRASRLEDDLRRAHCVVTWNSTCATLAALEGVPTFVSGRSVAEEVAGTDLSRIERPARPDRTRWAQRLAYCQWTTEEFARGLPWLHLTRGTVLSPPSAQRGARSTVMPSSAPSSSTGRSP